MKPWHAQAIEMRGRKMTVPQICTALGQQPDAVRWALDENNEKQNARERARLSRHGRSDLKPAKSTKLDKTAKRAWHAEAKQMFVDGRPIDEIARHFGKSPLYVADIVHGRIGPGSDIMIGRGDASFIEPHKPRHVRRDCPDTMAVCRAFAAGEIDRFELSRRLKGQS
jgi:hypothetical protein